MGWGNYGTIIKTTTGGTTWFLQFSGTTNTLKGVAFTNLNFGTAVGEEGTILRTTNGGTTWTPQASGTNSDLFCVMYVDMNIRYAVGKAV